MTESADVDEQVPVEDLTPEEASRIIHSHRKVRYGKETSRPQLRASILCKFYPIGLAQAPVELQRD